VTDRARWAKMVSLPLILGLALGCASTAIPEVEDGAEPRSSTGPNGDGIAVEDTGPVEALAWATPAESTPNLESEIRSRVEAAAQGVPTWGGGERIRSTNTLPQLYRDRGFLPIWIQGGQVTREARTLLAQIGGARADGLDPDDYHRIALDSLIPILGGADDPDDELRNQVDVEFLLTDAFLQLGSHLALGRLDPTSVEPAWTASRNGLEMGSILEEALAGPGVRQALDDLRPSGDRYEVLQRTLSQYERIVEAGGWAEIPEGPTLDPGDRSERVPILRARLAATGHLPGHHASPEDPELYDEALEEAVKAFQRNHGLASDGRVGPASRRALNVPATQRHRQLVVNLERWRWLPRELGDRYILVNIPGYQVHVVDDGAETLRLRAIVGRDYRQTPVFSAEMTYLALAPYWNLPPGITANDQLPRIREDPEYVRRQNMVLFENGTNRVVDPNTVNWTGMSGAEFNRRFRLRQEPGPNNALGQVKFMFPNRHNVYIHDTPARELFDRVTRDFSSGCIRVERPLELAAHLLRDDPSWTPERIREVIAQGRERAVTLPRSYTVHVQYWTAWVELDGTVHFRDDIYNRDPRVMAALAARPWSGE
jgi:L,D-transpeptidase YcbB